MENLPTFISIAFGLTTILTVGIFYKATNSSKMTLVVLLTWLVFQTAVGLSGFYVVTDTIPPRFWLLVLPPILVIIGLFTTVKGRQYIHSLDIKTLTILHTIRIPVEVVLFWLFVNKAVPELMTFEGRNFDILSGLTAPVIFYFGFIKDRIGRKAIFAAPSILNFKINGTFFSIVINVILSQATLLNKVNIPYYFTRTVKNFVLFYFQWLKQLNNLYTIFIRDVIYLFKMIQKRRAVHSVRISLADNVWL